MNAAQVVDFFLSSVADYLATTLMATAEMGLFTGAPGLSVNTVLADLAALEPTFTGYARQVVAPQALRRNANGDYIVPLDEAIFQPTAVTGALPVTVTGYFITDSGTPDHLLLAEMLDTPYTFVDTLSGLALKEDVYVKNLTVWGGLCSSC